MKHLLAISAAAALLLFSGCSQKEPSIDASKTVEVNDPSATTSGSASGMGESGTADSNEKSLSGLEGRLQTITFDFDKFNIRADMQNNLKINATIASSAAAAYNVKLEGNCDEWGSDEYNYALGLKRAKTTKDAMVSEGIDAARITMVSFGESNPTCTEQTQECWAKNRRVDFKLLP